MFRFPENGRVHRSGCVVEISGRVPSVTGEEGGDSDGPSICLDLSGFPRLDWTEDCGPQASDQPSLLASGNSFTSETGSQDGISGSRMRREAMISEKGLSPETGE